MKVVMACAVAMDANWRTNMSQCMLQGITLAVVVPAKYSLQGLLTATCK